MTSSLTITHMPGECESQFELAVIAVIRDLLTDDPFKATIVHESSNAKFTSVVTVTGLNERDEIAIRDGERIDVIALGDVHSIGFL
jgi:putative lipoic acid-binding regulatory protein